MTTYQVAGGMYMLNNPNPRELKVVSCMNDLDMSEEYQQHVNLVQEGWVHSTTAESGQILVVSQEVFSEEEIDLLTREENEYTPTGNHGYSVSRKYENNSLQVLEQLGYTLTEVE